MIGAYLRELAILKIIRQEKHSTAVQIFDLWQAGIMNQSEDWWTAQVAELSTVKQEEIKKIGSR